MRAYCKAAELHSSVGVWLTWGLRNHSHQLKERRKHVRSPGHDIDKTHPCMGGVPSPSDLAEGSRSPLLWLRKVYCRTAIYKTGVYANPVNIPFSHFHVDKQISNLSINRALSHNRYHGLATADNSTGSLQVGFQMLGTSKRAGLLLPSHKRALQLHSPEQGNWYVK